MNVEPDIFVFEGRTLEVRAFCRPFVVSVSVFEGDKQAISELYQVTREAACDARAQDFPLDLVKDLMKMAKEDVLEGTVDLI